MTAEPTEVERLRKRLQLRINQDGLLKTFDQRVEAIEEVDTLIAAVRAEALAKPTESEFDAIGAAAYSGVSVSRAAIAAYRRMRGAK